MSNSRFRGVKSKFSLDKKWGPALRGMTSDGLATLVVTLANLISVPLYINYLGAENYGVWIAIFSLVGIVSLFEIGVDQYLVSRLSIESEHFKKTANDLVSKVFTIKIYITIVYIALGVFFYNYYDIFISEGINLNNKLKLIILVLTSYYIVNLYINLYNSVLFSRQKFQFINLSTAIISVLAIIITLVVINCGFGIESFSIGLLLSALTQLFIYILYSKKIYSFEINFNKYSNKFDKEMMGYSMSFQVLKITYYYRTQLINLVINNIVGPYAVTVFNIITRLCTMSGTLINKIINPMFPQLAIEIFNNSAKILFIKVNSLIVRITILSAILIYFINPLFIKLWVGSGYEVGMPYILLYLVYFILVQSMSLYGVVIYSTKRFEKWPILAIAEVFISLILAITLGKLIGVEGIIIAMIISCLITQIYLFNIVLNQLGISKFVILDNLLKNSIYPNIFTVIILCFLDYFNFNLNIFLIIFFALFSNFIYEFIKKGFK